MRKKNLSSITVAIIFNILGCLNINNFGSRARPFDTEHQIDAEFSKYLARFGKNYATIEEYEFRKDLFEKQLAFISEQNSRNDTTYTVGLNKFSDMTDAEFSKYLGYIDSDEVDLDYKEVSDSL